MQLQINLTQVIFLWMRKTTEAKSHQVNFRSPLSRIHYYQSQVVTSIRNLTKPFGLSRNTNLQLNPYSNTQLDFYCSSNLPVQCTNLSTWLTNDAWIQIRDKHQPLEEDVGCKVLQFINDKDQEAPWLQNLLAQRCSSFFRENNELGHSLVMAFKIISIYV